jgi:hypothetical protein
MVRSKIPKFKNYNRLIYLMFPISGYLSRAWINDIKLTHQAWVSALQQDFYRPDLNKKEKQKLLFSMSRTYLSNFLPQTNIVSKKLTSFYPLQ